MIMTYDGHAMKGLKTIAMGLLYKYKYKYK